MKFVALLFVIFLAACAGNAPPNMGGQPTASVGQSTTTVAAGENVYDVAKRLNIGIRDLIDANQLKPPYRLHTSQVLIVPVPQVYTVIKGDTLYIIARRFKVNQSQVAQLNHLVPPFKIFVGQQLAMPGGHRDASDASLAALPPQPVAPERSVEGTPLPPKTSKPNDVDIGSPTALAPASNAPASNAPAVSPPEPVKQETSDTAIPAAAPKGFVWRFAVT